MVFHMDMWDGRFAHYAHCSLTFLFYFILDLISAVLSSLMSFSLGRCLSLFACRLLV
jgi:hypothetical protein